MTERTDIPPALAPKLQHSWSWCLPPGHGWTDLVVRTLETLDRRGTQYSIAQVKQKFGGLRLYLDFGDGASWRDRAFVEAVEHLCWGVCEECGTTKNVDQRTMRNSWITTLCEGCWNGRAVHEAR